jgi:4-hydroxyphenylpyruvate dioxygenase
MTFQPAIASPSVGHQTVHPIARRLQAAASHGFILIELVEDDLTFYARDHLGGATEDTMIQAARDVKGLCDKLGIKPFIFQPFWFYEGLIDRKEHELRIAKLRLWVKLVKILEIRIVQIPTNWMAKGTTDDIDVIVSDLIEMAEIGLEQDPVLSFAYEGVAWGTHIDTWQGTWDVVKRVNKANFGLCLDSYHIVARDWGDPVVPGCKRLDGDENLKRSLEELVREVDVNKVFYVQLGDAELLDQPLVKGHPFHDDDQLPRMAWSRNARLFAWENGYNGCLPLESFLDAIFKGLKFEGYLSMETFSKDLFDDNPEVPNQFAARAMESWKKTMQKLEQSSQK